MRKKIISVILCSCLIPCTLLAYGVKGGYSPNLTTALVHGAKDSNASESTTVFLNWDDHETESDFAGNPDMQDEEKPEEDAADTPVDDRIEAVLDGNDGKRCLIRPYHITDANYFQAYLYGETIDFETELGVWGTVTVHAVNPFQTNVGPYLFLLNEQGDVLYLIEDEFFEDFEITEVSWKT